jgi:hypothetical protein
VEAVQITQCQCNQVLALQLPQTIDSVNSLKEVGIIPFVIDSVYSLKEVGIIPFVIDSVIPTSLSE